jgi:rod shape determining protein RodA
MIGLSLFFPLLRSWVTIKLGKLSTPLSLFLKIGEEIWLTLGFLAIFGFFTWGLRFLIKAMGIKIAWKYLRSGYITLCGGAGLSLLVERFLADYQRKRLLVFISPEIDPLGSGYNIIQSKIAVGSGGLFGKGFLEGVQSQLGFLPERHTDFIFSVIGEEWGFVGASFLLLLYGILISQGIHIADTSRDMFGSLLAAGIVGLISFQVIVNIGMAIGMMPVVGLPLPLVSYGGSSLLMTLTSIGLLLNIKVRRFLA